MPALSDDMYCSEQICIPPTFPYLLRQYAKAAIRTQPGDLLKWSTAYFRCLSLNIPPPVKPRLEYPIPRDYYGVTPGWLKALIFQLQNNPTIPFKVLWDRWIGACLQHNTLIKILCLGGFDNADAIPWLRFIAICAGLLTDDLTHTMILICEILSEEPEGGSAMITSDIFIDLYKFLAKIDASRDQILRNYYFRDSLLSLWRDKADKEQAAEEVHEEVASVVEPSIGSKSSTSTEVDLDKKDDVEKVVSCPSLPDDDHYSLDYLKVDVSEGEAEGEVDAASRMDGTTGGSMAVRSSENILDIAFVADNSEQLEDEDSKEKELDKKSQEGEQPGEQESETQIENVEAQPEEEKTAVEEVKEDTAEVQEDKKEDDDELKEYESVDTISDEPVRDLGHVFDDDATLNEDLERLKAIQQEMAGETDEELEKFKCKLIADMPMTESQLEGVKHFAPDKKEAHLSRDHLKSGEKLMEKSSEASTETQKEEEKDKRPYDEVFVDAIPGIGAVVPDDLIAAVLNYVHICEKNQHGMFMPRNIRHYSCPPLEVLNY
ncbi:hypothetical protein GWI33_021734 [Rhynchophorus ferrugineus]|uniref:Uncharacterized protein n=1 Tax=Rhynchophorus ferrugineus TaxID=354439 RepID=A0A834IVL6_RHYFE|nr:hypothetical protein GWI33_021734 [Rhynchophorus ferrugineus]